MISMSRVSTICLVLILLSFLFFGCLKSPLGEGYIDFNVSGNLTDGSSVNQTALDNLTTGNNSSASALQTNNSNTSISLPNQNITNQTSAPSQPMSNATPNSTIVSFPSIPNNTTEPIPSPANTTNATTPPANPSNQTTNTTQTANTTQSTNTTQTNTINVPIPPANTTNTTIIPSPSSNNTNTSLLKVPDPLSGSNPKYLTQAAAAPNPGASVSYPSFGTSATRITSTIGLRHEYSRFDPFNKDKSMALLQYLPDGDWRVYKTSSIPYDTSGNLVRSIDLAEARWDPILSDTIWGLRDFSIITLNANSGQETIVKDFVTDPMIGNIISSEPDIYRITTKDEGESSLDKRYWAFILQGSNDDYRARYIFTWDRTLDKIEGIYNISTSESDIDWVGMSPLGNYALIGGGYSNVGNLTGLVMSDRSLSAFHKIDFATAHSDVALDSDGKEVIVMQNVRTDYIDMIPLESTTKSIDDAGESYAGTNRIPLIRLYYSSDPDGLNSGVHISCNAPGICVVSTYIESGMPETNWLDRSIVLVKLDRTNPEVYYLAKQHGTTDAYWEETHASISNDGKRVVWATNWNQNVGQEKVFMMQMEIG